MRALADFFTLRADARLTSLMRIAIGADACIRSLEGYRILGRALSPHALRLPIFEGLPILPPGAVPYYCAAWFLTALAFTVGWHARLFGCALAGLMLYVVLMDEQTYSNHLYLLSLVALLLAVGEGGAMYSLDALRRGARPTVPWWAVTLLKAQLSLVYLFAAAAKLNMEYLSGLVLAETTRPGLLPPKPAVLATLAVLSVIAEAYLAFALWAPKWRGWVAAGGVAIHLSMTAFVRPDVTVQVAVFAVATLSLYPAFFVTPVRHDAGDATEGTA